MSYDAITTIQNNLETSSEVLINKTCHTGMCKDVGKLSFLKYFGIATAKKDLLHKGEGVVKFLLAGVISILFPLYLWGY